MDWMKLYDMELGELEAFQEWEVWRVPGGWIFKQHHAPGTSGTFVPFDNEFQR